MAGLQGRIFGGYQLADQLGSAGVAEVYRARPTKPGGREAVVKVIYPEFARQPGFLPHFRQIVQATGKLASHPHILPTLASGEEGGYLYLITPFVAAGTLQDLFARGGKMGPADIGPFFRQLCEALGYAHSLGVSHGNVKPSNIFLYEGRHVMLGDFGLLWDVAHMDLNHVGSGGDALDYMAPEVAHGQVSQLSDVYSTGAVLFAAAAGSPPFRGRPADVLAAHAQQPVPHLAQVNPSLPPPLLALDVVIQRAMAKRPEQRFPSAAALAQAIEATIRQAAQNHQGMQPPLGQLGQPAPPTFTPAQLGPGQPGAPSQWAPPAAAPPVIPPLGGGLGQAAAALFNAPPAPPTYEPQGPSIRPSGLQFPPLPASATVDESMERGGSSLRQQDPNQFGNPAISYEPTARVAALPYNAAPDSTSAPGPVDDGGWPDLGESPADSGPRGLRSLGRARSGLGKRLVQPAASQLDGGEGVDENAIPSDRGALGDSASPTSGFPSIGGSSAWNPPSVGDIYSGQQVAESRELQAWVANAEQASMSGESGEVRAFSPTQLGLPRLTSPELSSMPPSWQEILSAPMPNVDNPRRWRPAGEDMSDTGMDVSMPRTPWRSNPTGAGDEWADASGEWSGPNSGVQPRMGAKASPNPPHWDELNRVPREDDLRFDSRLARKSRLRAHGRRGLMPRLLLVLLLLSVFDVGAVVIARPDLCPVSTCVSLSNKVHQAIPFLRNNAAPAPPVVSAKPAKVQLSVVAGKSASTPLDLQNATSASLDWQASAKLPWLDISPASGTLGVGSSTSLTVSAKATGIKPGPYTDTITVTSAQGKVTIPVSVTVTSASSATSTPTALQQSSRNTLSAAIVKRRGNAEALSSLVRRYS